MRARETLKRYSIPELSEAIKKERYLNYLKHKKDISELSEDHTRMYARTRGSHILMLSKTLENLTFKAYMAITSRIRLLQMLILRKTY